MTVSYTNEVSDCKGFGNFWRLLFRWRGSVYKLVWTDLLAYILIYTTLSVVYRVVLHEEQRRVFERVSLTCEYFSDFIPISFVLGFYVSLVIKRWWDQYLTLPWPDSIALYISTSIHGHDTQGRLMRRTILRYVNLSILLTLIMVTPRAKKRFPTAEHIVEAGFMTTNEKNIFTAMGEKTAHPMYYVPLVWAGTLVARARKEGRILDDYAKKTIVDELNKLRVKLNGMLGYDWISIPLVYTQVVSLAVYTFFLTTIMGRQFLDPKQKYPKNDIDFYFPFFTVLQFFFYMGWLKVAEVLVNPFGEDDDDFEVNWLIDRNIQVSYLIVDEMHTEYPELTQDLYYDEVFPQELPYTIASEQYKRDPHLGSTAKIQVSEAKQEFLPMLEEETKNNERTDDPEKGDAASGAGRMSSRRSFASSVSGCKSTFVSMLQNKLRQGDQLSSMGTSTGSPGSMKKRKHKRSVSQCESEGSVGSSATRRGSSRISLKRNNRVRSVSQSDSLLSDASVSSSAIKKDTATAAATPQPEDSDVIRLSREYLNTDAEKESIFYLSSSPLIPRKKVTMSPLAAATASPTFFSPDPAAVKSNDPILLKVSRLPSDNDLLNKGASTSWSGKGSRHVMENPSSPSILSTISQVSQIPEGGHRGKEGRDGHFTAVPLTTEDQKESNASESDADRTLMAKKILNPTILVTPTEESSLAEEGTLDDHNLQKWYQETWQV